MRPFVLLLLLSASGAFTLAAQQGASSPLALSRVSVVNVRDGRLQRDRTVVITGNRIRAIGRSGMMKLPRGTKVVDAAGKYLIPGLWDMHVHPHREDRALHFYPLFLAHGVTGIREMGSYLDTLLYWRGKVRRHEIAGPRVVWSTPLVDGSPPTWRHGVAVGSPGDAVQLVDSMQRLGFDLVKVYGRLRREVYFALAAEARRRQMRFGGHVPYSITPAEASDAGQSSIEHLSLVLESCIPGALEHVPRLGENELGFPVDTFLARSLTTYDPGACQALFRRFVANGTWQVPTLVNLRGAVFVDDSLFVHDLRRRFVPPRIQEQWEEYRRSRTQEELFLDRKILRRRVELVGELDRAGVGILAGTDASDEPWVFAGSSLHDELTLFTDAGLTPIGALQTATINPARYLEATDSLGTVEQGKVAEPGAPGRQPPRGHPQHAEDPGGGRERALHGPKSAGRAARGGGEGRASDQVRCLGCCRALHDSPGESRQL